MDKASTQHVNASSTPQQIWATDITCICTYKSWLYLAAVLDLFSHHVVDSYEITDDQWFGYWRVVDGGLEV